jgi:hypothetical protein
MKIYVVKKGSIMSDDHKVNVDTRMEDMEVLPSEIKDLLITWLFKFGHEAIPQNTAWDYLVDDAKLNYDIDATLNECCEAGYIDSLQDPFTRKHNHKLTNEGIKFLKKGEEHDK